MVRDGMLIVGAEHVRVVQAQLDDFIELLSHYEFSSFPYYVRRWGRDTMARLFMDYPVRVGFEFD